MPERGLPPVVETTIWFLVSEALSNAIKHSRARPRDGRDRPARPDARRHRRRRRRRRRLLHARHRACRASARASRRSAGASTSRARPGSGTTLTATIPLAPWRTSTRAVPRVRPRRRRAAAACARSRSCSRARARPASRSRASGSSRAGRRGSASGCRSTTTRGAATGWSRSCAWRSCRSPRSTPRWWTRSRARATGTPPERAPTSECREEIAALLGEPDWRLTDAEPMVILTYRSVPAAPISGSIL